MVKVDDSGYVRERRRWRHDTVLFGAAATERCYIFRWCVTRTLVVGCEGGVIVKRYNGDYCESDDADDGGGRNGGGRGMLGREPDCYCYRKAMECLAHPHKQGMIRERRGCWAGAALSELGAMASFAYVHGII